MDVVVLLDYGVMDSRVNRCMASCHQFVMSSCAHMCASYKSVFFCLNGAKAPHAVADAKTHATFACNEILGFAFTDSQKI